MHAVVESGRRTSVRRVWYGRLASPANVLFMSVFTSQAAVLVLSPILVMIAEDLDVSTAVAGQLRIVAAPVAALVAVGLATFGGALPLRRILLASTGLVAVGSLASAIANSFLTLALGQLPLWIGVAGLVVGGIGAAGAWTAPEDRAHVAARALAGAPAAWIVGMPLIGVVAGVSWRLAFVAVPLPAALVTMALLAGSRPTEQRRRSASLPALLRKQGASKWAVGEILMMSAWAGTLVFSGALFIETYGTSSRATGLLLAAVAASYLWGNALAGRIREECRLARALPRANVGAAVAIAATWIVTPNVFVTLALFAFASLVVGARTVIGTTYGFALAGDRNLEVGSARAASTHVGYLIGSLIGGGALALGGRPTIGIAFALLALAAAIPYCSTWSAKCASATKPATLALSSS
jgi:MFS transporter, DHA1 family, inner membrane transport protein